MIFSNYLFLFLTSLSVSLWESLLARPIWKLQWHHVCLWQTGRRMGQAPPPLYTTVNHRVRVILTFFLREITRAPSVVSPMLDSDCLAKYQRLKENCPSLTVSPWNLMRTVWSYCEYQLKIFYCSWFTLKPFKWQNFLWLVTEHNDHNHSSKNHEIILSFVFIFSYTQLLMKETWGSVKSYSWHKAH